MCQSKAEGGARCTAHSRESLNAVEDRIHEKALGLMGDAGLGLQGPNTVQEDINARHDADSPAIREANDEIIRMKREQHAATQVVASTLPDTDDGLSEAYLEASDRYLEKLAAQGHDSETVEHFRADHQSYARYIYDMDAYDAEDWRIDDEEREQFRPEIKAHVAFSMVKLTDEHSARTQNMNKQLDIIKQEKVRYTRAQRLSKSSAYLYTRAAYLSSPDGEKDLETLAKSKMNYQLATNRKEMRSLEQEPSKSQVALDKANRHIARGNRAEHVLNTYITPQQGVVPTLPNHKVAFDGGTIVSDAVGEQIADRLRAGSDKDDAPLAGSTQEVLRSMKVYQQSDPELRSLLETSVKKKDVVEAKLLARFKENSLDWLATRHG